MLVAQPDVLRASQNLESRDGSSPHTAEVPQGCCKCLQRDTRCGVRAECALQLGSVTPVQGSLLLSCRFAAPHQPQVRGRPLLNLSVRSAQALT